MLFRLTSTEIPPNCSALPKDKTFVISKEPISTKHALSLLVPDTNICCMCFFSRVTTQLLSQHPNQLLSAAPGCGTARPRTEKRKPAGLPLASVTSLLTLRMSFFNWEGITRAGKNWISKRSQMGEGWWEKEREPESSKSEDTNIRPDITSICACKLSHSLQGGWSHSNGNQKRTTWVIQSCRQRSKRWTAA